MKFFKILLISLSITTQSQANDKAFWGSATLGGIGDIGSVDLEYRVIPGLSLKTGLSPFIFTSQPTFRVLHNPIRDRRITPYLIINKYFNVSDAGSIFIGAGALYVTDSYFTSSAPINLLLLAGYRIQYESWFLDFGLQLTFEPDSRLAPGAGLPFVSVGIPLF